MSALRFHLLNVQASAAAQLLTRPDVTSVRYYDLIKDANRNNGCRAWHIRKYGQAAGERVL